MPVENRSGVLMLAWAAQQHLTPHQLKKEIYCLLEESFVLLIILKIQKTSMKMRKQVFLIPISIWLSFRFSLWNLCGGLGASLRNAASWVAKHSLQNRVWDQGTKKSTSCHFASYILSFGVKLINGIPVRYVFFTLAFLPGRFPFEIDTFTSLYFFSRIYFLILSLPQKCNFWLMWDISVITYSSSFPILWDWDRKSKCSKLLLLLCWDCPSFPNSYYELFTMSHIHCVQILYILSLYPWFSAFHTLCLTEWTWEHLCFPGCRNLDEVTAPSLGKHGPMFALLLPLAQWHPGRAQACGLGWAVAHSGQSPHPGSCVFIHLSCVFIHLRHTIASRLDVAAEPYQGNITNINDRSCI